jgi:catechol 2,3-dioxygenase-like lactoylglutathione lyase family enzyme
MVLCDAIVEALHAAPVARDRAAIANGPHEPPGSRAADAARRRFLPERGQPPDYRCLERGAQGVRPGTPAVSTLIQGCEKRLFREAQQWHPSDCMKRLATLLSVLVACPLVVLAGQLSAPNRAGVAMGHLHYRVRNVEANKRFWMSLGGTPIKVGDTEALKFPDTLIFLTQGESSGGSLGSVVNHVAFRVRTFAALESTGVHVEALSQFSGVGSVTTPEGERIELFEESSENLVFTLDPGERDATAERHNRRMTVPIIAHHIHLNVPEGAEAKAKDWYVKTFGGVPGKRWHYEAADLPGINMNFSDVKTAQAPTKGRMLDHVGFEVRDLEAFCRRLAGSGIKLDTPYAKQPSGIATAFLTDPWGTSIELTEGLSRF